MTVYYVDYSATNDGTGATAAQASSPGGAGAFNTLTGKTFIAGDVVWLRRVTTALQTTTFTFSTSGVNYYGWPKSSDDLYTSRPQSGRDASWDDDSNDEFNFKTSTTNCYITISASGCRFHRIKYENTAAIPATCITISGSANQFTRCYWTIGSSPSTGVNIFSVTGIANTFNNHTLAVTAGFGFSTKVLYVTGDGNRFYTATITSGALTYATPISGWAIYTTAEYGIYQNITITLTGTSSCTVHTAVSLVGASYNQFIGLTFAASSAICQNNLFIALDTSSSYNVFRDVTIDYCGYSAGTHISIAGNSNRLYITGPTEINNANARTMLLLTGQSNIIYWNDFIGNSTGGGKDIDFNASNKNLMFCDNCQFTMNPTTWFINAAVRSGNQVHSINHNRVEGFYRAYNREGVIESSSTYRTDGSEYSFRMELLGTSGYEPLCIGQIFEQTLWIDLVTGENTVTIYGAYKFAVPTKAEVWLEIDDVLTTFDPDLNALSSDTSEWNNDPDVTAFKVVKTITVAENCKVPLRVYFYKAAPGAYIYIDPVAVIT